MINGKTFDWEDIKVDIAALIDLEILAITYKSERPAEAVYGRGNAPRGYGRGNLTQEATVDLDHAAFLKLSAFAATQGGLARIKPFVITVRYANNDQLPQVDVLDGCVFTTIEAEGTQGDTEVGIKKLTLNVFNPIKYNGVPVM